MTFKEIISHEAACEVLGRDPKASTNIHYQLDDIAEAINRLDDNFVPDFTDHDQLKWRPWFRFDGSGFRFDGSYYDYSNSYSTVGSRLCNYFRSEEAASHFGKQFLAMHEKCFFSRRPEVPGMPKTYTDIKSHTDACKVLQKDPSGSITTDQKITDICKAMNKLSGFAPDFNNSKQYKWRPFFIMEASGFRFDISDCDGSDSYPGVGSRLCHFVGSEAEADHLGKQFFELHKEHYLGQ